MKLQATEINAYQAAFIKDSYSELELCVHWNRCLKAIYNRRKNGKMPPYFIHGKQIRYLKSDVKAFEQENNLSA
jgi:hypothetical protein